MDKPTDKAYQKRVRNGARPSPIGRDCVWAFCVGGGICVLGQALHNGYVALGTDEETAGTLVSVTLVFLSALLTGLQVYDRIAKHAGAGTLVPITGFANAVASPAMEFRTEGLTMPGGMASKMFAIAGPVIVFGITASVLYGIVLWLAKLAGLW